MNNVDAIVPKDEYGNLLGCVPPVTPGEYERDSVLENLHYLGMIFDEYDRVFRNRGDK